jgi:hypothetical protein
MANTTGTGVFNVCKATSTGSVISDAGVVTAGIAQDYYFQSSPIYANSDVATRTGIKLISADNWQGEEPLIKVDQMILSNKLVRLVGEYTATTGGIKTVALLCVREKVGDLLSNDPAKNLTGKPVLNRAGTSRGVFFNVRTATRSTFN